MADITEYLEQIETAVYGKDVRQAIHDGIEQCYEDGKAGAIDLTARNQIASVNSDLQTSKTSLQNQIDEIVAPEGDPSLTEVANARVDTDGIAHATLKERCDADAKKVNELKSAVTDNVGYIENLLGLYPNIMDARNFVVGNSANWEITSAGYDSIMINHKTTYTSGTCSNTFYNMPGGKYTFHSVASPSDLNPNLINIYKNGSYLTSFANSGDFSCEDDDTISVVVTFTTQTSITLTEMWLRRNVGEDDFTKLENNFAQTKDTVDSIVNSLSPVYSDIEYDAHNVGYIISRSTGGMVSSGDNAFIVDKFPVEAGGTYYLTASANYRNLLYSIFDENDILLLKGDESESSSTPTIINNKAVVMPTGASYVIVAYYSGNPVCKVISGFGVPKKWIGKKWVCVGDSLTEVNIRTTKHYFDYVSENTGISVVNMGVSGSGYARLSESNKAFYQRISACPVDADVVTIFGSFNDIGAGLPIGAVDDDDTTTLAGCINKTIDNLQAIIPLVNLGIVAPTPWDTTQPTTSGNAYNYVEMIKTICQRRSIPFLDLWRESNLRPWDADFRAVAYSRDGGSGTHPDENGHALIAPRFQGFLETLIL